MQEVFEKIIEKLEVAGKTELIVNGGRCNGKTLALGYTRGISDAIEIVKQEAEQYNNGWIPCSERLPKYGEVVMCSCTNSGITISCITHKGVKPSKSVRFGQHSVIAWQPLQQPYQNGE